MHGGLELSDAPKLQDIGPYLRALEREMTERAARSAEPPLIPASFPLGRAWFLACCLSGYEKPANTDIKALGYGTYWPQMAQTRILRGRRVEVLQPLFPGYIFVRFDRERDEWGDIRSVYGVLDIYSRDGIPVRVPDLELDYIRRCESAGAFDLTKPSANFAIGERVEIEMDGQFKGMLARIKSATAKKRVKILLDSLATITIDPCFLRKVE